DLSIGGRKRLVEHLLFREHSPRRIGDRPLGRKQIFDKSAISLDPRPREGLLERLDVLSQVRSRLIHATSRYGRPPFCCSWIVARSMASWISASFQQFAGSTNGFGAPGFNFAYFSLRLY